MIRRLRRRHRGIFLVLGVALPVAFVVAMLERDPVPATADVPEALSLQLTDEELTDGGELTEMVFPGLLTLVDALLPRAANGEPDRGREHRDVAHDFLLWLAARLVELRSRRDEDDEERVHTRREAQVTDELVDLVTYRLYSITDEEIARLKK